MLSFCWSCLSLCSVTVVCVFLLVMLLYKWSTYNFNHFKIMDIPYIKPMPFFGNFWAMAMQTKSFLDIGTTFYNSFPENKYFGLFELRNPVIMIKDPELIKQITVKDSEYFLSHRVIVDENIEPLLGKNLMSLTGEKWKQMRNTLSPAFTGSKIRHMLSLVSEVADNMTDYFVKECENNQSMEVDVKECFTRYTNDVIASCAFGIKINSFAEKDNEFYRIGQKASNFGGLQSLKFMGYSVFPKLMQFLNIKIISQKSSTFFRSLVHDTIKHRENEGIVRPDLIQLLIQARKGQLQSNQDDEYDDVYSATESTQKKGPTKDVWEDDDVTAQCFLFFIAGFETSSNLLCFTSHEIAVNPDVQKKLHDEIDAMFLELKEKGKKLSYENIQELKYLDMVISESLRRWPPAVVTDRICTSPYTINCNDRNNRKTIIKPNSSSFSIQ